MRMHPAIPLVTPHDTTQDIIYEGQFIPKGTSLVANTWCMGYNPEMFPEPESFKPAIRCPHLIILTPCLRTHRLPNSLCPDRARLRTRSRLVRGLRLPLNSRL